MLNTRERFPTATYPYKLVNTSPTWLQYFSSQLTPESQWHYFLYKKMEISAGGIDQCYAKSHGS